MRKLYVYAVLFLLFATITNCECRRIIEDKNMRAQNEVELDTTAMVVRYPDNWTQDSIIKFREENKFKTSDSEIERCSCGDTDIELLKWDYDQFAPGEIQSAKNNLKGGGAGAQGDEPFTMFIYPLARNSDPYTLFPEGRLKGTKLSIIQNNIKLFSSSGGLVSGDGITDESINIAIIDTGLDVEKFNESEPYLYPTAKLVEGCPKQSSGWNFADNTENIWDDHGHGTYVTRIITKHLKSEGIPFRILPVKAFSKEGKASYWDMVCAMNYIKKINQSTNNKIDIINASFGYGYHGTGFSPDEMRWYKKHSIFRSLIEELQQETLVFGSAGNINLDIDVLEDSNYPASFPSENLIGVGGYSDESGEFGSEGNFGKGNLDLAAPYQYKIGNLFYTVVEGSSFSTARVTALGAEVKNSLRINDSPATPAAIRNALLQINNNVWVKYDQALTSEIDEGRYVGE